MSDRDPWIDDKFTWARIVSATCPPGSRATKWRNAITRGAGLYGLRQLWDHAESARDFLERHDRAEMRPLDDPLTLAMIREMVGPSAAAAVVRGTVKVELDELIDGDRDDFDDLIRGRFLAPSVPLHEVIYSIIGHEGGTTLLLLVEGRVDLDQCYDDEE